MHIRELSLSGFKSFAERATLRFAPGMNAVIGPNGCGKTNILDALRWVLGEQSFSLLRCAKNEDLIFGGTAAMPAANFAEVRLVLADESGPVPEIEIRRRYFRSGESEYYLNRQPCRLRDIQDVFLSSGTGTKAYSIFDLRQMREIISGNIRKMFEEAASLAKYQDARADCQRKLALTEGDMVRLDDILSERERLVRSLQRQAGRLRAFDRLKQEEKGLRLIELAGEYAAAKRAEELALADTRGLEQADAGRLAEIARLEAELRELRAKLRDTQAHREYLGEQVQAGRQRLAELEGQSLLDRQRIELAGRAEAEAEAERQRLSALVAEQEALFNAGVERLAAAVREQREAEDRLGAAQQATREAEARLYSLREHEAALRRQLAEQAEAEHALGQELVRLAAALENQQETHQRLAAELGALRDRARRADSELGDAAGRLGTAAAAADAGRQQRAALEAEVRRVLDERQHAAERAAALRATLGELDREIAVLRASVAQEQAETAVAVFGPGRVTDLSAFIEIEPGWERACEAVLYAVADFLVLSVEPDAADLSKLAAARPDLRFGLLGQSAGAPTAAEGLGAHVRLREGAPAVLARLLAEFTVADDAANLSQLAAANPGRSFVTRGGLCRFADGRMVVESASRGRLGVGSLIAERGRKREVAAAELTAAEADDARLSRERDELDTRLSAVELAILEAEQERSALAATQAAATVTRDELARDLARVRSELDSVAAAGRALGERHQAALARHQAAAEQVAETTRVLGESESARTAAEAAVKERLEQAALALAGLGTARQAAAGLEAENAFAWRRIEEARQRMNALDRATAAGRNESAELQSKIDGRVTDVAAARDELARLEAELSQLHVAELARAEEELERNIAEQRAAQESGRQLLMEQRLKLFELEQRVGVMREEARASHQTDLDGFTPEPVPDADERLAQLRRRLEALGAVNPLAGDEYAREKQDLERLAAQRQDVAQAKANLEATLSEIDRHAREQFAATYQLVREHFREIFRQLFTEGEADLVLVDGANPMESEVSIIARPRGKNPKRLEQLSDGEKALLAVSLLFAFYRVKPAPFCFLDEVDAPLDDANVGRFADYLRGITGSTQVMIITHNRLTVERADSVFGVTAEQPGVSKLVSVSLAEYREREPAA